MACGAVRGVHVGGAGAVQVIAGVSICHLSHQPMARTQRKLHRWKLHHAVRHFNPLPTNNCYSASGRHPALPAHLVPRPACWQLSCTTSWDTPNRQSPRPSPPAGRRPALPAHGPPHAHPGDHGGTAPGRVQRAGLQVGAVGRSRRAGTGAGTGRLGAGGGCGLSGRVAGCRHKVVQHQGLREERARLHVGRG